MCFYSFASTSEHSILPESMGNSLKPSQVRVWPRVSKDAHLSKNAPLPTPPQGINIRSHYLPRLFPSWVHVLWVHEATRAFTGPPESSPRMFLTNIGKENLPLSGGGAARIGSLGCWPPCSPLYRGNRSVARMQPREKQKPGTQEGRSHKTLRTPSPAHLSWAALSVPTQQAW